MNAITTIIAELGESGIKKGKKMKEHIAYTLIKSNRTTISIAISKKGEVIVRAPRCLKVSQIEEMIQRKHDWIVTKQNEVLKQLQVKKNTNTMSFLGVAYEVKKIPHSNFLKPVVSFDGNAFIVHGSDKEESEIQQAFVVWYKKRAQEILTERTTYYANLMQEKYHEIRIKDQKTCFGSCSSKRNLNYNYRIIMAPMPVVDYLVIHELCHLKQMNHSKAFWAEVEKMQPDYKENRSWLMSHASSLEI